MLISVSRSRRGQSAIDVAVVVFILFALSLIVVFVGNVLSELNTDLQADADLVADAKAASATVNSGFVSTWDNVFVLALALMWVFLLVTAFLIDSHPIFFFLSVVVLVFVFVGAMVLSNVYQETVNDTDVASYAVLYPKMNWVMEHLLTIVVLMGLSSGLVLYAKSQG